MDRRNTNDVAELTKLSLKTFLNIAQMTQYRMKYVQNRDNESKDKMIKYTCLAGLGAFGLLAFGIAGLISRE